MLLPQPFTGIFVSRMNFKLVLCNGDCDCRQLNGGVSAFALFHKSGRQCGRIIHTIEEDAKRNALWQVIAVDRLVVLGKRAGIDTFEQKPELNQSRLNGARRLHVRPRNRTMPPVVMPSVNLLGSCRPFDFSAMVLVILPKLIDNVVGNGAELLTLNPPSMLRMSLFLMPVLSGKRTSEKDLMFTVPDFLLMAAREEACIT